jgi:peptidoglycan/xylan/chitin deacetylase (PgdA/CDA1 family)
MKHFLLLVTLVVGVISMLLYVANVKDTSPTKKAQTPLHAFAVKKVHSQIKPTGVLTPSVLPSYAPFASISAAPVLTGYCLTVPVLFYHHIQPIAIANQHHNTNLTVSDSMFAIQMQYISTHGYTTITTKQLIDALKNHTTLPPKSIVITLDDGYRDNYTYAFPIFQKYHLKANIMLATGLMEGSDYLTWSQVSEMKNSGLLYYTDHTWSHYAVDKGTTDKIQTEILTGQKQIEEHTGEHTDVFTYPYGSFSNTAIALLKQDNFSGAFTTKPGKVQCDSQLMTLPRTRIGNAPLSYYGI